LPYPHGADCRCPPLPPDPGWLRHSISCEHHIELMVALSKLAAAPDTSKLSVLAAVDEPRPEINRSPAPQPWQPRPSRRNR
jgi:hypothetical protein